VVICLVVLGMILVLRTQGERIALSLGDFLTARIGEGRNISVEFGKISGSLVDDVRLNDVIVTYTGGESPKILMSAAEVRAYFKIPRLLLGQVQIDSLVIKSPRFVFPKRPDGSRLFPTGDSKPGPPGRPTLFGIEGLRVENATVIWVSESLKRFTGISGSASYSRDEEAHRIAVEDMEFVYGSGAKVEHLSANLAILDDRVRIGNLTAVKQGSGISLSGYLGKGDLDSLALSVAIDSLEFSDVPVFMDRGEMPGLGSGAGHLVVRGVYAAPEFDLALDGEIHDMSFRDLNAGLSFANRTLRVERLSTLLRETPLDISCEYTFSHPPRYAGVVAFSGLDLSRFFGEEDGSFSSDLNGSVGFSGRALSGEDFHITTAPKLDAGRYRDYRFDSVGGVVEVNSRQTMLDSVVAGVGGTSVVSRGLIAYDGKVDLDFTYDCPDLERLRSYHRVEGLSGVAVGSASVDRQDGEILIRTSATSDSLDYRGAVIDSMTAGLDLVYSDGGLRGRCNLFGRSLDLMGYKAGELIADVVIEDRRVVIERVALTRDGGSVVGMVGRADFLEGGVDIAIDNLFLELAGLIWENTEELKVSVADGELLMADFALASEMGIINVEQGSYSGGRYQATAGVEELDLRMLRDVLETDIPTGTADMSLEIAGSADSVKFDLAFGVSRGAIREIPFQELSGSIGYDGRTLDVRKIELTQNGGDVLVRGSIPIDLAPTRVQELRKQGKTLDLIDDLGNMEINVKDVDIALLEPLFPPLARLKGTAELRMNMSGNRRNPILTSTGTLRDAVFGQTRLGEIFWDLALSDSVLGLTRVAFGSDDEQGEIRGNVPLAVSILPFESKLLDRPIDVAFQVENGNMGLMCDIFPRLKVCSGEYEVDLKIGGTVTDPTFEGFVKLSDSRLRMEGVAQDILDLDLELLAKGKRFEIAKLVAEGGALKADGSFTLTGTSVSDWDLDIELSGYELTEFEDFYARLDGDLKVTAAEIDPGMTVPRIIGDLTVKEGEYYFSPDAGGDGGFVPPTDRPAWMMDVAVEIPNDFWIKGDVVQAELQGDLSVRRGKEGLSVLGTLNTLRGKFNVYHNSMRISKGEFRFIDVKSFRNAYIDLEASSTVLDERVDLRATGYLDKLDISAMSESGWSEQQIFEALLLRRGVGSDDQAGNKFFSDAFLQSWGTALVNRFGDDVARELHLDQFGVEVAGGEEIDPIASTWVTFGKYVSSSVYVQYSQSLGSLYGDLYGDRQRFTPMDVAYPERQLSVEYRFSNRLSIEGETGTINGLEYFDFDVKFRFGY